MKKILLPLLVLAFSGFAFAGSETFSINFEQYAAYTQITNQYASQYATFTNALQLVAPYYDYFDYPPHSGSGVITNDPLDPIQVNFAATVGNFLGGVDKVTGWYTDPNGVTVNAYNSKGGLIETFNGAPVIGSSLEFSVSNPGGGIAYITISDNGGNPDNETVDDISYEFIPEPNGLLVMCSGLLGAVGLSRLKMRRAKRSVLMTGRFKSIVVLLVAVGFVAAFTPAANAEASRALITQKIDESRLVTLAGNTRPEANAINDRGPVSADLQMNHMLLLLQRSPESEKELGQFIEDQHNPKSPSFHKWLGAEEFGQKYGLLDSDIGKINGWLENYGLKVEFVYSNRMVIDFSGSASQIENAFHFQFRYYEVNGETYIANASDPKIPIALAKAVVGPVYLHNFKPKAMHEKIRDAHVDPRSGALVDHDYTNGGGYETIVPWDLAKIYNIKPLFSAGISGQNMTIVVVEDTNQWNCNPTNQLGMCSAVTSDWAIFRNTFGLGIYGMGNLSQENPGTTTSNHCTAPSTGSGYPSGSGINSDDVEASIDVQWASAAAPNASIINAACANPSGGFGGLTAIQNILQHPNADNVDVISMSYGESEAQTGATLNAAFNTTFQQAVTAGIGIFVSSGDELAASAGDRDGIGISGWMSSQYDVSVGGLDFADNYLGVASSYWNATNNVFYGSAKSYIMEQPWNDSCAGTLLSHYATGSYITYGAGSFCQTNSSYRNATGGSGGPSGCATGVPSVSGVVSGTCAGRPKPSYQSAYIGTMAGLVNDNVRDTPDVALMAANGLWGHYYLICYTDTTRSGLSNGGIPSCTATQPVNWPGYGGTSVSSPIMAAIHSLVVQHKGSLQGNPNPRYYALANTEYGPNGNANCDSTLGNGVAGSCIFYDITLGDIDGYCIANRNGTYYNCYHPGTTSGVLSTSNSAYQPAYPTGPQPPFDGNPPFNLLGSRGWDFASGIGSVNAYNLVMGY